MKALILIQDELILLTDTATPDQIEPRTTVVVIALHNIAV
jgi:hypothetical protein